MGFYADGQLRPDMTGKLLTGTLSLNTNKIDGQSYPFQSLQPNYEADQYVGCNRTLTTFRNDVNVDRYDYKEGYCLYVLEVDPYYSFNIKRKGHCRLDLKFAKPLPESVTLILSATFPEILNIEQSSKIKIRNEIL